MHTGKVLYGRPAGAKKIKYLDWLYKTDMNVEPYNNIQDLLTNSVEQANKIGINEQNEILPIQKRKILK